MTATTGESTPTSRTPIEAWTLTVGAERSAVPDGLRDTLEHGLTTAVPGSVLGALIDAGFATDVTVDGDEADVAWAAHCEWIYRTSIQRIGDGSRVRLVLEGVDTLATVLVDGEKAVECDDMFHRWAVDLGVDDSEGAWEVEVVFHPVLPVIAAAESAHPLPRADMYDIAFNQVRKMACSFGWDWGPTTITSGLWREAVLERIPSTRITSVRLSPTWDHGAVVRGTCLVDGVADHATITVLDPADGTVLLEYSAALDTARVEFALEVEGAGRWDVIDRGSQPLYDVTVRLWADDIALDEVTRRVGFRSVELVQEPDEHGRRFEIHVNGARVWARGFNWIPADVLPERVGRDHVRALVEEAAAAGANLLRVWGGGVVESDDFFDVCDELGILVWQDFSFACAAYAEDDDQVARVRLEVDDAVRRAGHRASLALWCGCNENLWGWEDWGWQDKLGADGEWGARLYLDVIPTALSHFDPDRPYIPGSPFSPDADAHPNDQTQGTTHHWDTWNQLDYVAFEEKSSRFASEFGWQAPASWPTLVRGIGHEPTAGDDLALQRLQKHPEGRAALARAVADHVPHLPTDGRGWYFATQLVQARAIRAAIGRFRSLHDTCSGALWWQLDDCWPALSWAVLDVARRRKLGWYASAEVMAPRAVIITADGDVHGLTLVNDLPTPWRVEGELRVVDERGGVLHSQPIDDRVEADGHLVVAPSVIPDGGAAVVVDVDGIRGTRWVVPDLELAHPVAHVSDVSVVTTAGEARVTVEAATLVRDLCLLAETHPVLHDAVVDRQLALLLPGETVTFTVRGVAVDEVPAREWASLLTAGTALDFAD